MKKLIDKFKLLNILIEDLNNTKVEYHSQSTYDWSSGYIKAKKEWLEIIKKFKEE